MEMTRQEILEKIETLETKLTNVHGNKCEVWSRVCGFFRPLKDWNNGKVEEFHERITYEVNSYADIEKLKEMDNAK